MPDPIVLDPAKIVATLEALRRRIGERFPGSGLESLAQQLCGLASAASARGAAIRKPRLHLRLLSLLLLGAMAWVLFYAATHARPPPGTLEALDLVNGIEATLSAVTLLGIAVLFVSTLEARRKRKAVLDALGELRVLSHVIDMHQLAKDPERLDTDYEATPSSPREALTAFELGRYLHYCSDLLALVGKIAAYHVASFQDEVVLAAVNEIEDLTNGLSRKIWQKLVLLDQISGSGATARVALRPPPSAK